MGRSPRLRGQSRKQRRPPGEALWVGVGSGSRAQTAEVLRRKEPVLEEEAPDAVVVSILRELWAFMCVRKKSWLGPILVTMVLRLTEGSALAPFIYALF